MTKSLPSKSLVLYADDDFEDQELVREAFHQYAHNIDLICFSDGQEIIQHIENDLPASASPCLIILDINMPRVNGKEVLKYLRSRATFQEIPVVLFSTSTLPSEVDFARRFDAGFVTKPLYTEQIHHIVDQLLEHCPDDVKDKIKKSKGN